MPKYLTEISDTTFEGEVLKCNTPVFVEFYNTGCGTCKMLEYILCKIAEKYNGRAKVVKICVAGNNETIGKYSILGAPTLILFKDGNIKGEFTGPQQKSELAARLDEICD